MKRRFYFFLVLSLLISLSVVEATFSVSSLYYKSNPLSGMSPGESKDIKLILSNPSQESINVEVSLMEGEEIANIVGGNFYELSPGQKSEVHIRIDIPEDAKEGENYEVSILSDSLPSGSESRTVQFSPSYVTSFAVIVGDSAIQDEPAPLADREPKIPANIDKSDLIFKILYFALSLSIFAVFVIIVILARRRKAGPEAGNQEISDEAMFK